MEGMWLVQIRINYQKKKENKLSMILHLGIGDPES